MAESAPSGDVTAAAPAGEEAGAVAAVGPGPVAGGAGVGGRVVVVVRPGLPERGEVVLVVAGPTGSVGSVVVVVLEEEEEEEVGVVGSSEPVPAGASVVVVEVLAVGGGSTVVVVVVVVVVVLVVVGSGSDPVVLVVSGEVGGVAAPSEGAGSPDTASAGAAGKHTTVRTTVARVGPLRRWLRSTRFSRSFRTATL